MKRFISNKGMLILIMGSLAINIAVGQTLESATKIQPPNAFDEYDIIDSYITEDLGEGWENSKNNMRGVEFQKLELDSNLQELPTFPMSEKNIYKGRVFLENRSGVIYSVVDPIAVEPKLNVKTSDYATINFSGEIEEPIFFYTYTNYEKNIKSYELYVYKELDRARINPIAVVTGENLGKDKPIIWDGKLEKEDRLESEENLFYILRVYDENGSFDETKEKVIDLKRFKTLSEKDKEDVTEDIKNKIYGTSSLQLQNIPVSGSKVRFFGRDLKGNSLVKIDNQKVDVDSKGDFIFETISDEPKKIYKLNVESGDTSVEYPIEVETQPNYEYLVGLADFYYGKNKISGSSSILENDPSFEPSYYNTGRLAAYYKAIKGKYKITAQADTWGKEIKNMFSDFHERDPNTIFRRIDNQYFPFNYGDESELYYDVETQGKAYLRVDWDKSQVLWGNYETGLDSGIYNEYNRSLYGARAEYNSLDTNTFGDSLYHIEGFASNPDTSYKRDKFLGSGGSIYYLSERDIVIGSAKLIVEITDKKTGRVTNRVPLTEGSDYTINELSGRIILSNPLSQTYFNKGSTDIIKDSPSGSANTYLVADYEYYSPMDDISNLSAGGRGQAWLTNNAAIGGTYVKENRKGDTTDYELASGDIVLKKSNGTYLKAEYSESKGNQLTQDSNWFSYNAGYDFIQQPIILDNAKGRAYYIEGALKPEDYFKKLNPNDTVKFWYSKKDKNFSTASENSGLEKEEYGIRAEHKANEKTKVYAEATKYTEKDFDDYGDSEGLQEENSVLLGVSYDYTDRLNFGLEGEYVKNKEDESQLITYNDNDLDTGEAFLLGARVGYEFSERLEGYTKLQSSVWRDKGYGTNNLITVGANMAVTEKLELGGAVSTGNQGDAVEAKLGYKYSPDYEIYTGYSYENEDDLTRDFTLGQKLAYNEKVDLYQEASLMKNYSEKGLLQGYGVDYKYRENLTLSFMYEKGDVEIYEGDVRRNTLSSGVRYESEKFYSRNRIEYGKDSGARDTKSLGFINNMKWNPAPEYTLFAEANYVSVKGDSFTLKRSNTNEYLNRSFDTNDKYYELGLGLGYRPIYNDRLNLISRWNYIYDTSGTGLVDSSAAMQFKAHIFSLEAIYDLTQKLSVAGKYAIRKDEVRLVSGGSWFDNTINLYALRATYEVIYRWDLFAEYHILENRGDDEVKQGVIAGIYRDINENLQLGVGYNFSKFTDDLSDLRYKSGGEELDYKSEGWFINLIGKF
ncbi:hypothetical protein [uncultured Cetobacterium sp.]|uniref:hypothetical protein n=1 Tax=uncultured Cetobacterium sp. TaxID=527638 RepID=UPI002632059D|nr:hypothetical protein [uncultured Cetobacterium sp.]